MIVRESDLAIELEAFDLDIQLEYSYLWTLNELNTGPKYGILLSRCEQCRETCGMLSFFWKEEHS